LAQFETATSRDDQPERIAQRMADTAYALTSAPSLFFAYRPSVGTAVVQAYSGFSGRPSPTGLSFRVSETMLSRVARFDQQGKTASLSDDPGLALLMAQRLGSPHCDAWAVTGAQGKLLGVMVVLQAAGVANASRGGRASSTSTNVAALGKIMGRTVEPPKDRDA
jgi:hypothetical protein